MPQNTITDHDTALFTPHGRLSRQCLDLPDMTLSGPGLVRLQAAMFKPDTHKPKRGGAKNLRKTPVSESQGQLV